MSLVLQSSGGGQITIQEPATASNFTQNLSAVNGTILTSASQSIPKAALPTGSVLQVVSATYSTATSSSSSTLSDTGLSATITPTSATSKILVIVSHPENFKSTGSGSNGIRFVLLRGSTTILAPNNNLGYTESVMQNYFAAAFQTLDSPATTSATTYKTQFSSFVSTAAVTVQSGNSNSSITLLEIAA